MTWPLPGWLARAAAARPDRPAVIADDGTLTYRELAASAAAAAGFLAGLGAAPGSRVAIVLPPGAAFAVALHGCWALGAVPVPISPRLTGAERAVQADGAAAVIDGPLAGAGVPAALPAAHDPAAPAVIVHTSGTTGAARPVALTFGNLWSSAIGSALALGLHPDERWLSALPVSHVGGLSILVRSAIYATTAQLHGRFDAERTADALARGEATLVSLVPTTLSRVLDTGLDRALGLRGALVGGGPLAPELAARARAAAVPVAQTYGLTEAASQVATSAVGEPQTAGLPLAGTALSIAADGEILVAGPTVAPGAAGPDGWLHTGDLGSLDARGRLTVLGRADEMIVTGGENVAPAEVEAALGTHPAVREAAVFGRPDPEWGHAVVARVVLRDGAAIDGDGLRAHCAQRLAAFKVPKAIELAPEPLPRTPSGKLRRAALS
ncbi:MAG: AMP-binding protein [Solirubrobacteraceae bacterium]